MATSGTTEALLSTQTNSVDQTQLEELILESYWMPHLLPCKSSSSNFTHISPHGKLCALFIFEQPPFKCDLYSPEVAVKGRFLKGYCCSSLCSRRTMPLCQYYYSFLQAHFFQNE